MSSLSASELQEQFAHLLTVPPCSQASSPYLLHGALSSITPRIDVSSSAVKTWWIKYGPGRVEFTVSTAKDLDEKYGHIVGLYPLSIPPRIAWPELWEMRSLQYVSPMASPSNGSRTRRMRVIG